MKIFAYNLCLQLTVEEDYPFFCFPLQEWDSLLQEWEQFEMPESQVWHVCAKDDASWVKEVFDFQTVEKYREKNSKVVFRFKDRTELNEFWDKFQLFCQKVEIAAGGWVQNEKSESLFILNRSKWTLPKGHVEKTESIESGAIREVQEETGLKQVSIVSPLTTSYHTFFKKNKWRFKITHWFLMYADSSEPLLAQAEENIEDVQWMHTSDWLKNGTKIYPQNKELFAQFMGH